MSWNRMMFCRPFDPSVRVALLLLNTWSFFTGLAAFFLYWVLSLAGTAVMDDGMAADIAQLSDVGILRQLALALLNAAVDFRQSGITLAVWGLSLLLLSSGLSLLLLLREMRRPTQSGEAETTNTRSGFVADLLLGRLPLWKAFWLVYVPEPFLAGLSTQVLIGNLDGKTQLLLSMFMLPMTIGLLWTLLLSVTVLVWRCSDNTARPVWGKVARVVLVLAIAVPLLLFLIRMLPFLGQISRS
ncbi:hypothetical protein [Azospira sp. I13]|uniref:hypothetical protein n=1 Tax=Azospira sp. I13 TaxID=1765050 RepID=UPI001057C208|nr:hypothetical protein [Azospira sp. I13]